MADPVLEIDELCCRYRDAGEEALRGVALRLAPSEIVALVGPSGAGKTTLCRCVTRAIPAYSPAELRGRIRLCGASIAGKAVHALVPRVGLVFQEFEAQLFSTDVSQEVAFGLENLGLAREEMHARVAEALALVGLTGLEHREPATLSGGQKQRLAIASIAALQPAALLMDEPTTDLDPAGRADVLRLARRLAEGGAGVLITDHEVDDLLDADRLAVLAEGRVVLDGPLREVLQQPAALAAHGIRPPQVAEFFHRRGVTELPVTVDEGVDAFRAHGWHLADSPPVETAVPVGAPLLELRHVTHAYPGGAPVLHDLSLAIYPGEIVAILGQNGCGKTTLAKLLLGLLTPAEGQVLLRGAPVADRPLAEVARQVGYVFQNPDHQIFAQTVGEEVAFGPRNLGVPPAALPARVAETLAAVGLTGMEARNPFLLPKGDRQRVAVASILAAGPEVLILDEPTTGLDSRQQAEMMALVRRLHAAGRTVILITHAMGLAAEHAHRCLVMAQGRILADGPPRAVFTDEVTLAQASLRAPAITRLGLALGAAVLTVDELLARTEGG
jgi:energy-coupling factor transporter ATP-binding protein EcfA2